MRRILLARTALAATVASGLVSPLPIGAAAAAPAAAARAAAAPAVQRARVLWRSVADPRWEVRDAAADALTSTKGDAVADFLATGLRAAEARAKEFERINMEEIRYVFDHSTSGSAVHQASKRALTATHDEKEEFVQRGLAAAVRLDAAGDKQHKVKVAKQTEEDRLYVAELARTHPGAQVRSAARFAVNSGRDEDLAEFFAYYWAAGARLDDEAYRLKLVNLDVRGNAAMQRLRAAAVAAQAAEKGASAEAAAKLRAETVAAWNAVAASADGTSVDWAAERDRAAGQADAWGRVVKHAEDAKAKQENGESKQDWAAVIVQAGNSRDAWNSAVQEATRQAAFWLTQAEQARQSAAGSPAQETVNGR